MASSFSKRRILRKSQKYRHTLEDLILSNHNIRYLYTIESRLHDSVTEKSLNLVWVVEGFVEGSSRVGFESTIGIKMSGCVIGQKKILVFGRFILEWNT